MIWRTRRHPIDLRQQAKVMGILNTTPDSFSDGGQYEGTEAALCQARRMIREGVSIIDVGGESTRPGSAIVDAKTEIERTATVISAIRREWEGWISIDTSKAIVAEAALEAGADIVNDVTGLRGDPRMLEVCAEARCGIVVMHMQGDPRTMQRSPHYGNVVEEIRSFFQERFTVLTVGGIDPQVICFDPGIGFGKTIAHNLELLRELERLRVRQRPLLLGISKKGFLGKIIGEDSLLCRGWPTVALTAMAREKGVMVHRVHAVRHNLEALRMIEAIRHGT